MKLYVGNLPYSATEADIEAVFTEAGATLASVFLARDRFSGQARGFGFVEIEDQEQAVSAIEACNGKDMMGRALVVNEARPKVPSARPPMEAGGGGGGGGGGGFRENRGKRGHKGSQRRKDKWDNY